MSVSIVSSEHVNVLVWAANQFTDGPMFHYYRDDHTMGIITREDGRDETARMLLETNAASFNGRYDDGAESASSSYQNPAHMNWSPVEILKAIQFYAYQSCEAPNWDESYARAFCDKLRLTVTQRLPEYEEAPWGIDPETVPVGD